MGYDTPFTEEQFSTAPLDGEVWPEDPIWIDHCASTRDLRSQTSSIPTPALVLTTPQPS